MNKHIPSRTSQHVCSQFMEFLEYLEINPDPIEWRLDFTSNELAWRDQFFGKVSRPVAGCVVASSNPSKDWHVEGYTEVINYIQKKHKITVLLIGGPSTRESEIATQIAKGCNPSPILALERPIRNTLLQISGCSFLISPDTGPLHAAIALGVPVIGLYGYSNPYRCGPFKYQEFLIDKFNEDPENPERITRKVKPGNMEKISANEVISRVELIIKKHPLQV
jgi:heptosyltransferase I